MPINLHQRPHFLLLVPHCCLYLNVSRYVLSRRRWYRFAVQKIARVYLAPSRLLPSMLQTFSVSPEIRMLYNPQLKGAPNFVPGVVALVLLIVCVMMTAIAIVKEKETGITIHYVNEHYDEGATIFQSSFPVLPSDTPEDVAKKGQVLEHRDFPRVIESLVQPASS